MDELKNYEDENFRVFKLPIVSPQMRFTVIPKEAFESQEKYKKIVGFALGELKEKFVVCQNYNIALEKLDDLDKIIADKKKQLLIEKMRNELEHTR